MAEGTARDFGRRTGPRRLLLVGAFRYPQHQGSQIYFQEQAIALRAAGLDIDLLTYAGDLPLGEDSLRWRGVDGFGWLHPPAWASPRSRASGPNAGKPLADLALFRLLGSTVASNSRHKNGYDAILTHNVEATLIAAAARSIRPQGWPPLVYCAHTLMAQELSSYTNPFINKALGILPGSYQSPHRHPGIWIDRLGEIFDTKAVRHSQGWIALTQSSERVMKSASDGPGKLITPPLPDPFSRTDLPEPDPLMQHLGLERDGFVLYSGNLDGYQELDLLGDIDDRLSSLLQSEQAPGRGPAPAAIVVASHDMNAKIRLTHLPGIRVIHPKTEAEMQVLIRAARATLVLRRRPGGFPIKIVNSLAWGIPPIVFQADEWGLTDRVDCLEADATEPVESMAQAIALILRETELARDLRAGARRRYEAAHRPEIAAQETLELLDRIL